jgi:hypothetical protein
MSYSSNALTTPGTASSSRRRLFHRPSSTVQCFINQAAPLGLAAAGLVSHLALFAAYRPSHRLSVELAAWGTPDRHRPIAPLRDQCCPLWDCSAASPRQCRLSWDSDDTTS